MRILSPTKSIKSKSQKEKKERKFTLKLVDQHIYLYVLISSYFSKAKKKKIKIGDDVDVKNSTFGNKKINVKFILENKRG